MTDYKTIYECAQRSTRRLRLLIRVLKQSICVRFIAQRSDDSTQTCASYLKAYSVSSTCHAPLHLRACALPRPHAFAPIAYKATRTSLIANRSRSDELASCHDICPDPRYAPSASADGRPKADKTSSPGRYYTAQRKPGTAYPTTYSIQSRV